LARIRRRLPPEDVVYYQKMEGGRGIPDLYVEGKRRHLWIELKVRPNGLSPKQKEWISRARANGQPVWVASFRPRTQNVVVTTSYEKQNQLMSVDRFVQNLVDFVT